MSVFAMNVVVKTSDNGTSIVLIDGVEFPFHLAEDGPKVDVHQGYSVVYLPVLADSFQCIGATIPDSE